MRRPWLPGSLFFAAVICVSTALPSPVLAAAFTLPNSFNFAGQSYSQVYLNDNGTITFGNEFLASGPNVTEFLNPGNGVVGVLAGGFGDYSSTNNWTSTTNANQTLFSFAGVDFNTGLSNTFSVSLFNDSTIRFDWNVLNAPNSILIGVTALDGGFPAQEADPTLLNFGLASNNPYFFYDFSLPGAVDVSVINGTRLGRFAAPAPEPFSTAGFVALGAWGALTRLKKGLRKGKSATPVS
ncbi:hypothetical protein [Anthocerotibacter panamensis]|uniref:hypothetical protein n=1 Tax=Anthocerotibacter panamensis TaxID=2857077 RepID=UPI001C4015DB|nr:hypothetical protein [Anthocerotibacter panamensis]